MNFDWLRRFLAVIIDQLKQDLTKQLRRIFNENHIPPSHRNRISVLRDECGVVWVSGVGVDERVSADENTERFLLFETVGERQI